MEECEISALERGIAPERVEQLVRRIAASQPAVNRGTVSVGEVLDDLLGGRPLTAKERSAVEPRLTQAIVRSAGQSPALGFADGG